MRFANAVAIRRPVAEVFAYLSDFRTIPAWNYAIAEARQTSPGEVGVGTTIMQTRTIPNRTEESLVVTEFVPNSRLQLTGDLGPFRAVMSYDLDATPDGTRLTNTAELEGHGLAALASPLVGRRVRDAVAANLDVLRDLLERRPA